MIVITGATGFIGGHVTRRLLQRGMPVRVLARRMPQDALDPKGVLEVVMGDLFDRTALQRLLTGADTIVHIAGAVKARESSEFFRVNVQGTESLLAAAETAAPRAKFIHISSLAAREPGLSPYAGSKAGGENMVTDHAGTRAWTIIRPPVVYGPGDHEILPMFKLARHGICPYPGLPKYRLSLIHVEDLAEAIIAAVLAPSLPRGPFEVDDGAPGGHSWQDIASALGEAVGRHCRSLPLPRAIMQPIAYANKFLAASTGRATILTPEKLAEIYWPDWVAHSTRLQDHCNWRAKFSLWKGFQNTAAWYRTHRLLA